MKEPNFIIKLLPIFGIGYAILNIYNTIFSSKYLPEKYGKYIWSSLENAPVNTQRIALFSFLMLWVVILYIAYYLRKKYMNMLFLMKWQNR